MKEKKTEKSIEWMLCVRFFYLYAWFFLSSFVVHSCRIRLALVCDVCKWCVRFFLSTSSIYLSGVSLHMITATVNNKNGGAAVCALEWNLPD